MTPASRVRIWLSAIFLVVASAFTGGTAMAQSSPKIAVIDLNRAIADTEDGIRVKAELTELFDARQSEYETKEKTLAESKADYDRLVQAGKTKQDALRKKLMSLEKMAYELQVAQQNYRREMQQAEYQKMQPIIKQMLALVRRLASKQGYEMVLNKEAVPFFRSDLDITERIVQMYNAAKASTGPKGKAPKGKAPKGKAPKGKAPKARAPKGGSKSSRAAKKPRTRKRSKKRTSKRRAKRSKKK